MISDKKHIRQLASILHARGIEDIVISPGSRNGPLIHTFVNSGKFNCRSIVDERSAGYFALGLAQALGKPVALVTTSGTAVLNLAPAMAEAFYLNVPLIALTADRPGYWINQGENQTIRQNRVFSDFFKKAVTLPLEESEKELWHAGRLINEALNAATDKTPGPVHINIPLEEPLHELQKAELPEVKIIRLTEIKRTLSENELEILLKIFNQSEKVLVLAGQTNPDSRLEKVLASFVEKTGAVILHEHLANLNNSLFCSNVELLIASLHDKIKPDFQPDLVISFGGAFVSGKLRQFLRKNPPKAHWRLDLSNQHYDTYQSLTQLVEIRPAAFFEQILPHALPKNRDFLEQWKEMEKRVNQFQNTFVSNTKFCDLSVFQQIIRNIPKDSVLHLGNSSPVRYATFCEAARQAKYYANRGVSGIDGSLSTAVGFASHSKKLNTVILGDLSFFYDSNALWNSYVGSNLRIIVIHNGGGNIFGMLKGPDRSAAFNSFFFTENKFSAKGIAEAFDLGYLKAENKEELDAALHKFYAPDVQKALILEIFTDAGINSEAYRKLFAEIESSN